MTFGAIMESWKNAFSFFSKRELGLFVFSWFRTFKRASLVFLKYFSWLAFLEVTFFYLLKLYGGDVAFPSLLIYGISTFLNILVIFFAVVATRASLDSKGVFYFAGQMKKLFGFILLFFLFAGLKYLMTSYIPSFFGNLEFGRSISAFFNGCIFFARVPLVAFIYLFFLDSSGPRGLVLALKNGCKTVCYFFPVVFLLFLLPSLLQIGLMSLLSSFSNTSAIMLAAIQSGILPYLVDFLALCAVSTYYLKIKYSHYPLFFE
jgi:hypothetical protein